MTVFIRDLARQAYGKLLKLRDTGGSDSAYQRFGRSEEDALANAAKRHRVDTDKLAKAVAQEFAAKHKKHERKTAKKKSGCVITKNH